MSTMSTTGISTQDLEQHLQTLFSPHVIKDFCPNGLQVQGKPYIRKLVTGVTATKALIEAAIAEQADAIFVHHGYFWKNEPSSITGMKYERIKLLLDHQINLFAYHLPLDIHPELGNNAQLAQLLAIKDTGPLEPENMFSVARRGELLHSCTGELLAQQINTALSRECLHISPPSNKTINTVAWCSGGGQSYIELAAAQGIDAFITGEVSEQTTHIAQEMGIHFFAAGHHATERYGVKAIADYLTTHLPIEAKFIDINNPV